MIRETFETLPKDILRKDSTFSGVDIISFATYEIERAKKNQFEELVGPLRNLTFFAFDFINNNRLLWGEDVLKEISTIPNPKDYEKQRMDWIKKQFLRKEGKRSTSDLLISLGRVIRHYAVLDGIRDLKRAILKNWANNYPNWPSQVDFQTVIRKYFSYITDSSLKPEYLDQYWKIETENLIKLMIK